ncbi:MAG TPA: WhiB family transcriptional regulator [Acidimicrobiales bacterium]|nr:WhiB family transcriptional regulator [Acidimicrobiales bacterium]
MFALQDHTEITIARVDWTLARCADDEVIADAGVTSMTDLFFSDEIPAIRAAKAICATCPLADPCLAGAVERREPWGVWGGQLFKDGKVLAVKRPRGRPPKDPARWMTA